MCVRECGNGVLEPAEQCDPGMSNPYGCSNSCTVFGGLAGITTLSNGRVLVSGTDPGLKEITLSGGEHAIPYSPSGGTFGWDSCGATATLGSGDSLHCIVSNAIIQYPRSGANGVSVNINVPGLFLPREMEVISDGYWVVDARSITKLSLGGAVVVRVGKRDVNNNCCEYGTGDGQFDFALGLGTDPSGQVYVADMGNSRIQVFTSQGGFVRKFGSSGTGNGQFGSVVDVAADNSYIYTLEGTRVQKFTQAGSYVSQWAVNAGSRISINKATGTIIVGEVDPVKNASIVREYNTTGTLLTTAP
jgi:cysteine-rich repeat protein